MSKLKPCEEAVDHEAPNGERERTGEVEKERERLEERGGEIDEMGDGGRERQRERPRAPRHQTCGGRSHLGSVSPIPGSSADVTWIRDELTQLNPSKFLTHKIMSKGKWPV